MELDTPARAGYLSIEVIESELEKRWYCGRAFGLGDIELIRHLIPFYQALGRTALSRRVCDELGWFRPDGRRKDMSCRVALLRMERDELITLPTRQSQNGNGRVRPAITGASDPGRPIDLSVERLPTIRIEPVGNQRERRLYNEHVERYHYLGYKPLAGAQLRYLAFAGSDLVAMFGFGAAAWAMADRDRFIGWSPEKRKKNLHLVVGNARFLILPWVGSRNLASCILGRVARRLPDDWVARYGYRPVLLETCIEKARFRGTCYRAANWIHVGETSGRGKCDTTHRPVLPIKDVLLYPLSRDWRRRLCDGSETGDGP